MVDAMKLLTLRGDQLKEQLLLYLKNGFELEELLFSGVIADETYYRRADPLRHPIIFYYGHTAAFYINKLIVAGLVKERINPEYESIFAVGVDEMSWDDLEPEHYNWPDLSGVRKYRKAVYELVRSIIENTPRIDQIRWKDPLWAVVMGMEHQRIHIETTSVLIRQLPLELVTPPEGWEIAPAGAGMIKNQLVDIDGGEITLGRSRKEAHYGWDNEYGSETVTLTPFKAGQYLVSNGEYRRFVEAGGYQKERYWCEEGWRWVNDLKRDKPLFWIKDGDNYRLRTVFREIELPLKWPVEVNYLEAKAFCRFLSVETGGDHYLPTEAQWQYLLKEFNVEGNVAFKYCSACDVDQYRQGALFDLMGNIWEWTETPIYPLSGFQIHPYYDDFTLPTFDDQHHLIKGGSWISTGNETLSGARYAFRKHFYQHAGFRYVVGEKPDQYGRNYIFDQEAARMIGEQFFPPPMGRSGYDLITLEIGWILSGGSIAVIGGGPGGLGYRLTNLFDQVTVLEWSAKLLTYGVNLQKHGSIQFRLPHQGDLDDYRTVALDKLGVKPDRISFFQSDPENLKEIFSGYDMILLQDALVRMRDPDLFLKSIDQRINQNGYLAIISDYSFNDDSPLKSRRKDGEPVESIELIKELLKERFREQKVFQQMIFTPESGRSFRAVLKEVSIWQLRTGYGIKTVNRPITLNPSGFSVPF